jgi:hypothetical protein
MADFYPVLTNAVARLQNSNAQVREELYQHARAIVETELRQQVPRKSARDIVREQAALEAAIRRVEAELHAKPAAPAGGAVAPPARAAADMNEVLKSVGIMLLGMTCIVAMLAFTAVLFIRGLIWVYAEVISYPTLFTAMAIVLCLLVLLYRTASRKIQIEEVIRQSLLRAHGAPRKTRHLALSGPAARLPLRH